MTPPLNPTHSSRCGENKEDCSACARTGRIKKFCWDLHVDMAEMIDAVNADRDSASLVDMIELFTTVAIDLALEGTRDPMKAMTLIRNLSVDRMNELVLRKTGQELVAGLKLATPAKVDPPAEPSIH